MTQTVRAAQASQPGGALLKKIVVFSVPLALSSILQLLFNAADVVVVGRFAGSAALAAVGSTGSLINLLTNLFIGISLGANVVAARCFGAQDKAGVQNAVHTSVVLSLASGALLAVVGIGACRFLLELMSCPEDVIGLAALYLRIYFAGMPAMMLYNFCAALLRAVGDTRRPLVCLATAGLVNVVLNLFFVIVLGMSVDGVALATIISQVVSAAMVVRILLRESGPLHLEPRRLRVHRPTLVQILRIGVPSGLQGTVFSLSNVVIQSGINSFGSIVVAGNSAAANLEGFVYQAMNAFAQACVTFTSQNVGARQYQNIGRVLRCCLACAMTVGLALGVGCYALGPVLCRIYSTDTAVVAAAITRLGIICTTYCLCGAMDCMASVMRGMGYSVLPMVVSLLGSCAFRLVWVATVFRLLYATQTLYVSYPASWLLTLLAHCVCFAAVWRKQTAARAAAAA